MKMIIVALSLLVSAMTCVAAIKQRVANGDDSKPWLVVENSTETGYSDFPRLLVMQLAKAKLFRCVDRATYRSQIKELSLGDGGGASFVAAGYLVSWVIRPSAAKDAWTVSIAYNSLKADGNNEVIESETVMVCNDVRSGMDPLTLIAAKSATAILMRLSPPEIVDVEHKMLTTKDGRKVMGYEGVVNYGRDFFNDGQKVKIIRRIRKRGVEVLKEIGTGQICSSTVASSIIRTTVEIKEEYILDLVIEPTNNTARAKTIEHSKSEKRHDTCPKCEGKRYRTEEIQCYKCAGAGALSTQRVGIGGRYMRPQTRECANCKGRGIVVKKIACEACNATGKVSANALDADADD